MLDSDLIIDTGQRINHASELSRSVRLTARMLLDLADQNGYIRMEYDAALQATDIDEVGTLRGHLSQLKSAGILALYHINGAVEITFTGFPTRALSAGMIARRASARAGRADDDTAAPTTPPPNSNFVQPRAPSARQVAIFVQQRAEDARTEGDLQSNLYISHAPAHALGGWVGIDPITSPREDYPPTHLPPSDEPALAVVEPSEPEKPGEVERAISWSLLLSSNVLPGNAKRLSETKPFWEIRRAFSYWWMNRISMGGKFEETPGIIVRWLDRNPINAGIPGFDPEFLRTDEGKRWRTKAEIETERLESERKEEEQRQLLAEIAEIERQAAEQRLMQQQSKAQPSTELTLHELWQHALHQLKGGVPASTFDTWLTGTHALGWEDETLLIATPNKYACDWLQNRLSPMVKRLLTRITGQAIDIRFVVSAPIVRPEDT